MSDTVLLALIAALQPIVLAVLAYYFREMSRVRIGVARIQVSTDGMKEALMLATSEASFLKGEKEGKVTGKEELHADLHKAAVVSIPIAVTAAPGIDAPGSTTSHDLDQG